MENPGQLLKGPQQQPIWRAQKQSGPVGKEKNTQKQKQQIPGSKLRKKRKKKGKNTTIVIVIVIIIIVVKTHPGLRRGGRRLAGPDPAEDPDAAAELLGFGPKFGAAPLLGPGSCRGMGNPSLITTPQKTKTPNWREADFV